MRTQTMAFGLLGAIILQGCAGVSIRQLEPSTMAVKAGTPNGAVYYLPKPYLLVARLPVQASEIPRPAPVSVGGAANGSAAGRTDQGQGQFQGPPPGGEDEGKEKPAAAPPAASGTNTSFLAQTGDYVLKLVYLPDMTRPMAITAKVGLFGTAKLSPTFQDGWMLTGFTSEADSKMAEIVGNLAGIINAVRGPAPEKADEAPGGPGGSNPADEVLKPGFYEFVYNPQGRLIGLKEVAFFTATGAQQPASLCRPVDNATSC